MSSALERREVILEILSYRRFETMNNLACELNVSRRTIQNDIVELSSFAPLYTVRGRYGGGVHLTQGFYWYRRCLSNEQKKALTDVINGCSPDCEVLQSIIDVFSKK
ncbi:MAG: HTH domain-containing protein [Acutalibacteraceae bacterium]